MRQISSRIGRVRTKRRLQGGITSILAHIRGGGNRVPEQFSRFPIITGVLVSDFDYHLPPERIAQQPLEDRAASRMLLLERSTGAFRDAVFRDLPARLHPQDLVVFNDTRVFPARLLGHRSGRRAQPVSQRNPAAREFLTGMVEVLLTRRLSELEWQALVRPGRKIGVGERLFFGDDAALQAEVIARGDFGERTLRFDPPLQGTFFEVVEQIGHVPLPPYIGRPDQPADRQRYQTVYARQRGSVAAPTAGLHFTPEILEQLADRNIETTQLTLHVGLGTFQPVHAEHVEDVKLHSESYSLTPEAAAAINRALRAGHRVVAIGTTTVRTLEFLAAGSGGELVAGSGEVDLFIAPGFQFRVVGALLTNFHLPRSTLLMLVCAFAGREPVLAAYRHAVAAAYRFYSYGDCMFIE
jgi:S-adenosylmethionine:tRNA ribosyltransferase-isomerase